MKTFNYGIGQWKKKWPHLIFAGAFLFFLLAGKNNQEIPHDEFPPVADQEIFRQETKHHPDANRERERSSKGTSAIMIGLPF